MKCFFRRGGPPISLSSTRLKRGSVQTGGSGDDSTTQDESIDGEETVNWTRKHTIYWTLTTQETYKNTQVQEVCTRSASTKIQFESENSFIRVQKSIPMHPTMPLDEGGGFLLYIRNPTGPYQVVFYLRFFRNSTENDEFCLKNLNLSWSFLLIYELIDILLC